MILSIKSHDLNEYLELNINPLGYDREKALILNKFNGINSKYVYPMHNQYSISKLIEILDSYFVITINKYFCETVGYEWEVILTDNDEVFYNKELIYALWDAVKYVVDYKCLLEEI